MAKRPGTHDEALNSSAESSSGDVNMESDDVAAAVSLEEILKLYSQPVNEEQAWALCYQCCRTLAQIQRKKSLKSAGASAIDWPRRIEGAGDVLIWRDGTVKLHFSCSAGEWTHGSQRSKLRHTFVLYDILDCFLFFFLFFLAVWSNPPRGHIVVAVCFQPCGEFVYRRPVRSLITHHTSPRRSEGTADKPADAAVGLQPGSVQTAQSKW